MAAGRSIRAAWSSTSSRPRARSIASPGRGSAPPRCHRRARDPRPRAAHDERARRGTAAGGRPRAPAPHPSRGAHSGRAPPRLAQLYLALERRLARWTRTVISVSATQEAEALALGLFTLSQSATVVNGVDLEEQDRLVAEAPLAREGLGLARDLFVLGTVARFDPVKRLDALVGALGALRRPRVALLLVGGGPEGDRLRRLAAGARLDGRVVFSGWLDEPARVFPAIDLYVSASQKEGLPLAVLDAMGAGLAVGPTDVPGHRDG